MTERKKDEPVADAGRPRRTKRRDVAKAAPAKPEKAPIKRLTPDWSLINTRVSLPTSSG